MEGHKSCVEAQMKWPLVFVLALALSTTGAWADRYSDCGEGKNIDRQIRGCTQIIEGGEQEPQKNKANAHVYRALAYFVRGDFDLAIADYDKAIALNPNNAAAYNNRAVIYHEKGEYDRSIADLTKAITIDPSKVYFINRGSVYSGMGQVERAIADYTMAMDLNPNDAIALDANDAAAYNYRGVAHVMKGNKEQAIADFRKALEIDPSLQPAKEQLERLGVTP